MSRVARTVGGWDIKIRGRMVNVYLAEIVYKCEVCFGGLRRKDKGLICETNPDHRGFIHRDEVKGILEQRAENIERLQDFYVIKDGKVMVK